MKTEQLTEWGLSEEQIKQVFAENGKDIKAEKDKALALEATLTTAKQDLDDYREKLKAFDGVDVAKLQGEIKTLQDTIATREETENKTQQDKALTDNILAAFGDKAFTSDYVKNGLIADIKTQLSDKANAGKGIKDIFESLTKDKEGIFTNQNTPPPAMGGMGDTGRASDIDARAVMGLPPLK